MRRAGSGAAITVLHMLLTVVVLFQSTGAALSRFDAGGAASGGDVVFSAVLTLLLLPVALPLFELDVSAGDGGWHTWFWSSIVSPGDSVRTSQYQSSVQGASR
jgi:hypothetical protein